MAIRVFIYTIYYYQVNKEASDEEDQVENDRFVSPLSSIPPSSQSNLNQNFQNSKFFANLENREDSSFSILIEKSKSINKQMINEIKTIIEYFEKSKLKLDHAYLCNEDYTNLENSSKSEILKNLCENAFGAFNLGKAFDSLNRLIPKSTNKNHFLLVLYYGEFQGKLNESLRNLFSKNNNKNIAISFVKLGQKDLTVKQRNLLQSLTKINNQIDISN